MQRGCKIEGGGLCWRDGREGSGPADDREMKGRMAVGEGWRSGLKDGWKNIQSGQRQKEG